MGAIGAKNRFADVLTTFRQHFGTIFY